MKDIARQIRSLISKVEPRLFLMTHDEMGFKPDLKKVVEKGNSRAPNRFGREQSPAVCKGCEQSCRPVPNIRSR